MVLLLPTAAMAALTAITVLVALWEWTRMAGFTSRPLRSAVVAIVALALVALWLLRDQPLIWYLIAAGVAWWIVAFLWLRNFSFGAAPTRENAAIKLVAGLLATLPAWIALSKLHADPRSGPAWALLGMMLVWVADTAAYFAGRKWGRRKLAPSISPGKTWEGAWGGLAAAVAYAIICGTFLLGTVGWLALVASAALLTAISIVGDLFESAAKRQAGVKDSGTLLPGHGGIMDRIDSATAVLPVAALLLTR